MTKTDGPVRTCVGCRAARPAADLVRAALIDGVVVLDRRAPGRGAWLCADRLVECLDVAIRRRAFARAFRRPVERVAIEGDGPVSSRGGRCVDR